MVQPELNSQISAAIAEAYDEFISSLNKFSEEQINIVPFEDSWTPGQVTDHIIKGTKGIPDKHTQAADRPIDAKVAEIESLFLNFDIKMKSPEFILPADKLFNKKELLDGLNKIRLLHLKKIKDIDMTALCLDFALPGSGYLTRYEWYRFIVVHCRRHSCQLQRIYERLAAWCSERMERLQCEVK